jgi:hypothetical protein
MVYITSFLGFFNTGKGKGKVKFSPLQALEALRVVRG